MARKSRRIVAQVLDKWGKRFVREARGYLSSTGSNATGATSRGIKYRVFREKDQPALEITSDKYLHILDRGFRPLKKGASPKFVSNIIEWMKAKGIQPRSGRTGRFVKRTPNSYKRNAFVIARSIARKGYKGIGLTEYLEKTLMNQLKKDVANAYVIQFTEEIRLSTKNK